MKIKTIDRPFEVKSTGDKGTFTGYASVFGALDSYRDIVMPGAFSKSLADFEARGRKVPILWQHRSGSPIGVYDVIKEDDKGLYVEGSLNTDVIQAREAHSLLKQGALSGISIGFNTVRDEFDEKGMVRKLFELDLWEASLVTFPALDEARVDSVKSFEDMTTLADCESYLRDVGMLSQKEAKAIVSRIKALEAQRDVADGQAESLKRALDTIRSIKL